MNLIDIRRRLERLETARHTTAPTAILADRPMNDDEAAGTLADWRALVAQGRAGLSGSTLYLTSPELTEVEWAARHVTEH